MPFTLAGLTATQTGEDTSLTPADLGSIAGVTRTSSGSAGFTYVTYKVNGVRLVINGTLTINPEREMIATNSDIEVNGTLNIGTETTTLGYTEQTYGTAIVITASGKANSQAGFDVKTGGTLNWVGATVKASNSIFFRSGSTVNIKNSRVIFTGDRLIRSLTTGLSVDGLRKVGGAVILAEKPASFSGYFPVFSDLGTQAAGRNNYSLLFYGGSTGTTETISVRDFEGGGNETDIGYIDGARGELINAKDGPNTTVLSWLGTNASPLSRNGCYIETIKEIGIQVRDAEGTGVNARYNFSDTSTSGINERGEDNTETKTYTGVAVDGRIETECITGIFNRSDNNLATDQRFTDNSTSVSIRAYNYTHAEASIQLVGTGRAEVEQVMLLDNLVTEADATVVQAYDSISTPQQFYDRLHLNQVSDFTNSDIVREEDTLDFGDLNVILIGNTNANPISQADSTEITIYTNGVFTGNIRTTGTFTLQEGATVVGAVRSNTGVLFQVTGFPIDTEASLIAWYQSDGINNAFGTSKKHTSVSAEGIAEIELDVDTAYFIRADAQGYSRQTYSVDTTTQTGFVVELEQYGKNVNGVFTPTIPSSLTAEQQLIANQFELTIVNDATPELKIDITLPADYEADTLRWDSLSKTYTYTESDFGTIAFALNSLGLRDLPLSYEHAINFEEADIIFDEENTAIQLRQNASNADGIEINFGGFAVRRVNDENQRATFIDRTNGYIRVRAIQPSASLPAIAGLQSPILKIEESVVTNRAGLTGKIPTQAEFETLMAGTSTETQNKYKGSGSSGGLTEAQATALTAIQGATITDRETNLHADLNAYTSKDAWKGAIPTQAEFDASMEGTTDTIQDLYKGAGGGGSSINTSEIVDAILDVPYGKKADGTTDVVQGSLGEHWYLFYPPEIITQLLTYDLDGATEGTRLNPLPQIYGDGTLGDALRKILIARDNSETMVSLVESDAGENRFTSKALEQAQGGLTSEQEEKIDNLDTGQTGIKNGLLN